MKFLLRYYYHIIVAYFWGKTVSHRNSLSTKIIMMVECIILISSILFCTVSVYRARVGIRKSIQQRMLDIANCASGSVNGDVLGELGPDDVGSKKYTDVYNTLAVFRDNVELEYVYSIKEESEGRFIFTMDTDPLTPASYGDSVEYTKALASAGRGVAAVDEIPYTDQWGSFYSAYSPVFDSSGKVSGIVAVDFSVEWFEEQLSAQTRSTVAGYAVILLFSLFFAACLSMLIVRPFVRMQGQLLEEKVRAESANRAKSDFLANMSHEIRTPINAVLGMNEMILREERKAQTHKDGNPHVVEEALNNIGLYAADVKKAGHNLLAIVGDILDFSKLESGQLGIVESPYQLSSLVNDLSNMMMFKAQDKGLDFSIDVEMSLPDELCGDEVRIRQILTNLLNNAIKYTEYGSVRLSLRGEKQEGDRLLLTASVSDTGIGIKAEDKEKLFTRFQRLDMDRNSTVEGTGLGLVITHRLLEMMGGSIDVESVYGKGSVFTVTFPQKVISEAPIGDRRERFMTNMSENGSYKESFHAPKARILIVDDTRINLSVVVNLLKNTKMQIDTSTDGADAVNMARKYAYDLIFMDQRMPEMDGTEAFHKIRETENGASKDAPVVCLTADAVIGAKERYLSEGFTDYLTKPVDSAALESMLIKYLPEDKVERVIEEVEKVPEEKPEDDEYSALKRVGIDTDTGLKYCQNDNEFYRTLLTEYAQGKDEKIENLRKSLEECDWKNYAIHVHSLKSTSKMIGATLLSEMAAKLETAANAGNGDAILAGHDDMMERYDKVISAICSVITLEEAPEEDGDIMEFAPGK